MPEHSPNEDAPRRGGRSLFKIALNTSIGLAFSALFVWLAVRNVDWSQLQEDIPKLSLWPLAAYFGIISCTHALRLYRWGLTLQALLPESEPAIPWKRIFVIGAVGMMAIFALPARLGELVRPLMIAQEGRISVGQATATVVVERLADGLCVSLMLFITVLLIDPATVSQEYIYSGYAATAFFASVSFGLLVGSLLFRWIEHPLAKVLSSISQPLSDKIIETLRGFFMALKLVGKPRLALKYTVCTAIIWVVAGVAMALLFQAYPDPLGQMGVLAGFATLSVLVVGIMIPAGPGTVGVFHWAIVFGLGMFLVPESQAFLYGTVLHLLIAAINIGYGLLAWFVGDVQLSGLWKRDASAEVT